VWGTYGGARDIHGPRQHLRYWYLEATADLMRDVAAAGEGFMSEGRQP
jgi:hypothetical protein